jgi:uncharacterized membrane protein HdeD (DUF308 family)
MATQRPAGTGRHRAQPWWSVRRATFAVGLVTTALGLVVAFRPTQSLSVVMVLFGLLLIISGAYQLARAIDSAERERVWRGVAAAAFIIAGLVMIRHMHFSLAVVGLVIGVTWVLQGVALLAMALLIRARAHAGWTAFFGVVSLVAGIVVMAAPAVSVATMTSLVGAWFVVMGLLEMLGTLLIRPAAPRPGRPGHAGGDGASVPGQRTGERTGESAPGGRLETP